MIPDLGRPCGFPVLPEMWPMDTSGAELSRTASLRERRHDRTVRRLRHQSCLPLLLLRIQLDD